MLQLLRGAGVKGLAAMPRYNDFGKAWLGRPLLDMSQAALREYAQQENYSGLKIRPIRTRALTETTCGTRSCHASSNAGPPLQQP